MQAGQRASGLDWLCLCLLGAIWGASFLGISVALSDYGPVTIAAARIALGAIVVYAIARISGTGYPAITATRTWLHCLGFALFTNAIPFSLLGWGQLRVTSGFAGISMAVVPLFVLPLAAIVLREKLTPRRCLGFALGFAGVVVLVGIDALGGAGDSGENLARLACIGAACCYAIGSMITRTAPETPLLSFSAAGLALAAILMLPAAYLTEGVPNVRLAPALVAVIALGLFPTALATILLVRVIKSAGPSFMSLVNYHVPVWAVVNGLIFLKEPLPAEFITALALILVGLAIAEARAPRFRS